MKNLTILALQGPTGTAADLAPLVDVSDASGGHLSVVHIGPISQIPAYAVGAAPYAALTVPEAWVIARNEMAEQLAAKQTETRDLLQSRGIGGEVSVLCAEPSALHDQVAGHALFADLCVVQNNLRDSAVAFNNAVYGLLFESPAPLVLNATEKALAPDQVMIAWNNTLPAARAVRAALPMLKHAGEVTIACFDPSATQWGDGESPGADLASWLSHHGCRVTVQEFPSGGKTISDAIVDRATAAGADLVVMGAYGRSRLNERLFGGTTRSMIQQQKLPVLLAH